jgi:glucose/arabinose dehydrogenase
MIRLRFAILWFLSGLLSFLPTAHAANVYPVVPAFEGTAFQGPVQVVFAPGETNRAFVVELSGRVAMVPDLGHPTRQVILDLSSRVSQGTPDHGLLSMAFHPRFAQNGFFYLWTSIWDAGARYLRLLRFTLSPSGTVDPASEVTLISQPVGTGGHDGGTLLFGSDGYLYLSIGDGDEGQAGAEAVASHQRIDRGFFGAVLRLDVDEQAANLIPHPHDGVQPTGYRIPADNPFVGASSFNGQPVDPSAVRTEFWAVGLRNPFRMAFDSSSGELWVGDVGLNLREEIDVVARGGNYGWNFAEGSAAGPAAAVMPGNITLAAPVWQYGHEAGDICITGGVVCRNTRFAQLQGQYVFADYVSGRIWAASALSSRPFQSSQVTEIAAQTGIVGITIQPGTGDLLFANLDKGLIQRLGDASTTQFGPTISVQPSSQTIGSGGSVAFNVTASASPAASYQWYRNGTVIAGATSTTLLLTHATAGDAGAYTCTITNAAGSAVTAAATLTVVDAIDLRRVVNISTRGFVGTGANILIGGFIIAGTTAKTVLIRASGPALAQFISGGTLPDPQLQLFDSAGTVLAGNRGWGGSVQFASVASSVGAFPWTDPGSADSALLVTLPPGAYTAQVSGASGDTGTALLEVYDVP